MILFVNKNQGILFLSLPDIPIEEEIILFGYPTMLDILNSLKQFSKDKFQQTNYRVFRTIKKGIVDYRDEYPLLSIEPEYEEIITLGSNQMFIINRKINFKVWYLGFEKLKVKSYLRKVADEFKKIIKPILDDWMLLDGNGKFQVFDMGFEPEEMSNPLNAEKQWVQSYTLPVVFSSYFTYPVDKVITTHINPTDYDDLLETIFGLVRQEVTFKKYFRDVITPNDIGNMPGLYIGYNDPEANRDEYSSAETVDVNIDFEIFSDLATREVALDNHLRKVTQVFNFILKYEDMQGKLELFRMTTINYGIRQFPDKRPIYSTVISTVGNFNKDLYLE